MGEAGNAAAAARRGAPDAQKAKPRQAGVRVDTGAGNETRTRDPDLGKVVLYQLSYSRGMGVVLHQRNMEAWVGIEPAYADLQSAA